MTLDQDQTRVIEAQAANVLTIAGPGSGKTRALIARMVADFARGIDPRRAVCITFTVAGAREIEKRIEGQRPGFVGTLHAWAIHCIRRHGEPLGYTRILTVIDAETSDELLKACMAEVRCKDSFESVRKLKATVGKAIVTRSPGAMAAAMHLKKLRKMNAVDFDTALTEWRTLLSMGTDPGVSALYVDEFQDSAAIDLEIYDLTPREQFFAVGDPDQSIYGFRGARMENILEVAQRPGVFTVNLGRNYRSGVAIVHYSNKLIRRNTQRIEKVALPMKPTPGAVDLVTSDNLPEENALLIQLANLAEDKTEFAILTRYNHRADEIATILSGAGVPVQTRKKTTDDSVTRMAVSALAVIANPDNELAGMHWALETIKASQKRLGSLAKDAETQGRPLSRVLWDHFHLAGVAATGGAGNIGAILAHMGVTDAELALVADHWTGDPTTTATAILDASEATETQGTGVYVGTLHSSKGREWDAVAVTGFEAATMPGNSKKPEDVEAERRLAFVGMTRARNSLTVLACREITDGYKPGVIKTEPGRFFLELAN